MHGQQNDKYTEMHGQQNDKYTEMQGQQNDKYTEMQGQQNDKYTEMHGQQNDKYTEMQVSKTSQKKSDFFDPGRAHLVANRSSPGRIALQPTHLATRCRFPTRRHPCTGQTLALVLCKSDSQAI